MLSPAASSAAFGFRKPSVATTCTGLSRRWAIAWARVLLPTATPPAMPTRNAPGRAAAARSAIIATSCPVRSASDMARGVPCRGHHGQAGACRRPRRGRYGGAHGGRPMLKLYTHLGTIGLACEIALEEAGAA